jgi:hypothetical protein
MTGLLTAARRGLWHGLACIATTGAAVWLLERFWGRP